MGLVRPLQTWDILLTYCNNQLKKYIAPLLRLVRGGRDVSREQHRNINTIKGETDHWPRLDAWDKRSDLVLWEDLEGVGGEGGGRGDRDGEDMWTHGLFISMYDKIHHKQTNKQRLVRGGILHSPSDVYVKSFLCPLSYFNKTLLHKSSWVMKPGPWSQSYIFFRDHESDIVHGKLSPLCTIIRGFQPLLMFASSLPWDLICVHTFDTFPSIWGFCFVCYFHTTHHSTRLFLLIHYGDDV